MQIQTSGKQIIILKQESNWLDESEQRELISYLWKNKPDMIRDIVCENCPEIC